MSIFVYKEQSKNGEQLVYVMLIHLRQLPVVPTQICDRIWENLPNRRVESKLIFFLLEKTSTKSNYCLRL